MADTSTRLPPWTKFRTWARSIDPWRDIDHDRRKYGLTVWATGGELSLGRRLYRVRWWHRG